MSNENSWKFQPELKILGSDLFGIWMYEFEYKDNYVPLWNLPNLKKILFWLKKCLVTRNYYLLHIFLGISHHPLLLRLSNELRWNFSNFFIIGWFISVGKSLQLLIRKLIFVSLNFVWNNWFSEHFPYTSLYRALYIEFKLHARLGLKFFFRQFGLSIDWTLLFRVLFIQFRLFSFSPICTIFFKLKQPIECSELMCISFC